MDRHSKRVAATLSFTAFGYLVLLFSFRRSDMKAVDISVPRMSSDKDVRNVTNAVVDKLTSVYYAHDGQINREMGLVIYHEGPRLRSHRCHAEIIQRIRQVVFDAQIVCAWYNLGPLIPDAQGGWRESWPTRHTAVIKLPEIKTNLAASIIVDAIGVAMSAEPGHRIVVDRYGKKLTVTYESMALSPKSIEAAIARGGHTPNDILANHGR